MNLKEKIIHLIDEGDHTIDIDTKLLAHQLFSDGLHRVDHELRYWLGVLPDN